MLISRLFADFRLEGPLFAVATAYISDYAGVDALGGDCEIPYATGGVLLRH